MCCWSLCKRYNIYFKCAALCIVHINDERLQEKLAAKHGVQCGFCSPGMVMSMFALLRNNLTPTEQQIEHAIKGFTAFIIPNRSTYGLLTILLSLRFCETKFFQAIVAVTL
jgi:hypothetical protein